MFQSNSGHSNWAYTNYRPVVVAYSVAYTPSILTSNRVLVYTGRNHTLAR